MQQWMQQRKNMDGWQIQSQVSFLGSMNLTRSLFLKGQEFCSCSISILPTVSPTIRYFASQILLKMYSLWRLSETSQKNSLYLLSSRFRSEYGTLERTKLCLTQTHQNMEVTPGSIQLFNILLSMKNMRDADSVWIFICQAEQRWCWQGLAVGKRKESPVIENLRCLKRISGAKIYLRWKKI